MPIKLHNWNILIRFTDTPHLFLYLPSMVSIELAQRGRAEVERNKPKSSIVGSGYSFFYGVLVMTGNNRNVVRVVMEIKTKMCGVGGSGEKAIGMRRSEKGGGKMTFFFRYRKSKYAFVLIKYSRFVRQGSVNRTATLLDKTSGRKQNLRN